MRLRLEDVYKGEEYFKAIYNKEYNAYNRIEKIKSLYIYQKNNNLRIIF